MKRFLCLLIAPAISWSADDPELAEKISRHQTGSSKLSDRQDELAADVQQLTIEQTQPKVIELFREVEDAMDEASERLYEHQTDGVTIAAQTEVIEKIYEAAKERQSSSGSGSESAGGAMMDMLERMMGKEPGQGQGQGEQPGDSGGEGMTGDSDTGNTDVDGTNEGNVVERRVPKGAGKAGKGLPAEFGDALRAYNRGAEKLLQR